MPDTEIDESAWKALTEITQLRRMLGILYAGPLAYTDDGELQDNRTTPFIDFMKDTPQEIQAKMRERSLKGAGRVQATEVLPSTPKGSLSTNGVVLGDGLPDFPDSADTFRERLFYQIGVADERERVRQTLVRLVGFQVAIGDNVNKG